MKILFLCNKMPYPPTDGGAIAILNMIKGFAKAGDEVSVIAMQTYKHPFSIEQLPSELKQRINWQQVFVDTRIKPIKALRNLFFSKKPYNAVRFDSKQFNRKLISVLNNNIFDIVQFEGLYLYPYVNTVRKYSEAKVSYRAHNIESEIWFRLAENSNFFFKKKYLTILARRIKEMEKSMIDKSDIVIPITDRDSEVLITSKNKKYFVSPTGIEDDKFAVNNVKFPKTIFYIGALDWIPNQEGIMWFIDNVWEKNRNNFGDWSFVIAGRNAPESFEKELGKRGVKYVGEVDDAVEFIDNHNIMVVPLLSGSGMRIKIIEGMARGKCILTTPVGVEGISAQNEKEIFVKESPESFYEILYKLIKNPEIIDRCGENAYIFARNNYTNSALIEKLRLFYTQQIS